MEDAFIIVVDPIRIPGKTELHGSTRNYIEKNIDDMKKEFSKISSNLSLMISELAKNTIESHELDTIEFTLGFNSEGSIAFIAKAGVQASISITFKKNPVGS